MMFQICPKAHGRYNAAPIKEIEGHIYSTCITCGGIIREWTSGDTEHFEPHYHIERAVVDPEVLDGAEL